LIPLLISLLSHRIFLIRLPSWL